MFTIAKTEEVSEESKHSNTVLQEITDEEQTSVAVRVGFGNFCIFRLPFSPETIKDLDNGRFLILAFPRPFKLSVVWSFLGQYVDSLLSVSFLFKKEELSDNTYCSLVLDFKSKGTEFYQNFAGRLIDPEKPEALLILPLVERDPSQVLSYEVPNCPKCIDFLEYSITGIIPSISLEIYEQREDIQRWQNTSQMCSCCSTIELYKKGKTEAIKCSFDDHATQDLWICLICGVVGCGRYSGAHLTVHFTEKKHRFTLNLKLGTVWDYEADCYVHRVTSVEPDQQQLIQNLTREDSQNSEIQEEEPKKVMMSDIHVIKRMERVSQHYNKLMMSQLQEQQEFYEEMLKKERAKAEKEPDFAEEAQILEHVKRKCSEREERLKKLEKDLIKLKDKKVSINQKKTKLEKEISFLEELNSQLREKVEKQGMMAEEEELQKKRKKLEQLEARVKEISQYLNM